MVPGELEGWDFLNALSGTLRIELSEPPQAISPNLVNQKASPEAQIESVTLEPSVYLREQREFRELTDEELARPALRAARIRLRGEGGGIVEHEAPDGEQFTVADLIAAVEETERQTRGDSEWFDGVDVHHVFFEGLHQEDDDLWRIDWGS